MTGCVQGYGIKTKQIDARLEQRAENTLGGTVELLETQGQQTETLSRHPALVDQTSKNEEV